MVVTVTALLLLTAFPALLAASTLSPSFVQHVRNNGLLLLPGETADAPSGGGNSGTNVNVAIKRPWPVRSTFKMILDEFVGEELENRFVINLGAQDGDNYDPVFELLLEENRNKRYYSGIFVEASRAYANKLNRNVKMFNQTGKMQVFYEYALPSTIVSRLTSANSPQDPDVLKIDIDSVDLPVLEAIFKTSTFRPKVVMAEVNSDIPLPWMWYQTSIRKKRAETFYGNYGAGVYPLYHLLDSAGYVPVGVELGSSRGNCIACEHNVWFVSKELYQRKTSGDSTYDITFLDFSRSFWITLLKYSTYARSVAGKSHKEYLQLDNYAVSCVQMEMQRCPYTLMQKIGQQEPLFQNRDFSKWQTWYDLQMYFMSKEASALEAAGKVMKAMNKALKRLDHLSGVNESYKVHVLENSIVPAKYLPTYK
jgi:hypothetical protein